MTIEQQLETFRENFPLSKVNVCDTYMVYRVKRGWGKRTAKQANDLISQMNLTLTAIPTTLRADDSFIIQSGETEY